MRRITQRKSPSRTYFRLRSEMSSHFGGRPSRFVNDRLKPYFDEDWSVKPEAAVIKQHADFFTTQDHINADTRSDLLFKFALFRKVSIHICLVSKSGPSTLQTKTYR